MITLLPADSATFGRNLNALSAKLLPMVRSLTSFAAAPNVSVAAARIESVSFPVMVSLLLMNCIQYHRSNGNANCLCKFCMDSAAMNRLR